MLSHLCISFLALTGNQHIRHPEEVMRTLRSRVVHQWNAQDSGLALDFDNPNCAFQGTYFFNEENMVLSADHEHWRGRLESSFTDVLEGRSLAFSLVRPNAARGEGIRTQANSFSETPAWKRWAPWVIAIVGAAAGTYMWVERERHIDQLRGLKVSF